MEAAWIGLGGVALGWALNWLSARSTDRRRWRREDRQRWHDRRLEAYASTLAHLTTVVAVTESAIASARPLVQAPWTPNRVAGTFAPAQAALNQALDDLELIRLVGDKRVVEAAEQCMDALARLYDKLSGWTRKTPQHEIDELIAELDQTKDEMRSAARAELNVDVPSRTAQAWRLFGGTRRLAASHSSASSPSETD